MRAFIERLRLAVRDWLNAPSAEERAYQADLDRWRHELHESFRRD